MACYATEADAVVLNVRLTPRSSQDSIRGVGRLSDGTEVAFVTVRAVPADGAANTALLALLAKAFDARRSAVTLRAGGKSRLKRVRVEGDVARLVATIEDWPLYG